MSIIHKTNPALPISAKLSRGISLAISIFKKLFVNCPNGTSSICSLGRSLTHWEADSHTHPLWHKKGIFIPGFWNWKIYCMHPPSWCWCGNWISVFFVFFLFYVKYMPNLLVIKKKYFKRVCKKIRVIRSTKKKKQSTACWLAECLSLTLTRTPITKVQRGKQAPPPLFFQVHKIKIEFLWN